MLHFIIKRIGQSLLVIMIVTVLAFTLVRLAPGNPARLMLPEDASAEDVALMEQKLGLDKPLIVQYWVYLSGLLRGDLGTSFSYRMPVADLIGSRLLTTFKLALAASSFAIILCIPLGIIAGSNRGKPADFFAITFALVGQSMSPVWLAVLLVFVFSVRLSWLPAIGDGGLTTFILPAITLGFPMAAEITRVGRSGMIDTLSEDYITAIYARGVKRSVVNWKYAFRNAVCPVITLLALGLSGHLAGSVVAETIFALPGIGQMINRAIEARDYPIIQSSLVFMAVVFSVVNLLVDIVNSIVDPRISLED